MRKLLARSAAAWPAILPYLPIFLFSCVGGDAVGEVDCGNYCAKIETVCTGDNMQFADRATCAKMCVTMPLGALGDQNKDTLGCRLQKLSEAQETPSYEACKAAGPVTGCAASPCDAYCALNIALCTGANAAYPSVPDCVTACNKWDQNFAGKIIGSKGDSLQCRTYHLQLALPDQASLITHCPHTKPVSAVCSTPAPGDGGADTGTDTGAGDSASDAKTD